jgi:DNA-directed RNA polymerase specialized sigma24 family protein
MAPLTDLSADIQAEISLKYRDGLSTGDLASLYGTSRKAVEGIVANVRKHAVVTPHAPSMELTPEQPQGRPV